MKTKRLTIHIKSLLVGLFSIISVSAFSQRTDTIRVSSIDELFEAIASNKIILMAEGNYDISKLDADKKTNSSRMQKIQLNSETFGNTELVIKGVSNLKIIGIGKKQSKIFSPDITVNVLKFNNCKNIVLENLEIGHKATQGCEGDCMWNIIDISESENFEIKKSLIYGIGAFGISADNVKKLSLSNTTITGLSSNLFYLNNCINTSIDSCTFTKTSGGVSVIHSLGLTISHSEFSDNTKDYPGATTYFFDINASTNIKITKSTIESNKATYFVKTSTLINIDTDTDFKDNKFFGTFEN